MLLPFELVYQTRFLIQLIVTKFIDQNQLPHLLFYGPPGTGKTTTILACARKLYAGKQFNSMVLELNASDDRGINIVREQILTFASTRTMFANTAAFKLIILDEADAMTNDAQNALRRGNYNILQYTIEIWFYFDKCISLFLFMSSYRKIHRECAILYYMQLFEQNYTGIAIALYTIPLCSIDGGTNPSTFGLCCRSRTVN